MKFFVKFIVCCLIYFCISVVSFSQTREYMVKAGFIERFARFTEWPGQAEMDTFKIMVIGKSPFGGALEKIFATNKIKNKSVVIEYISSSFEMGNCHILFISKSESESVEDIVEQVSRKPVLTIGETHGYTDKGVIINFFKTSEGTIHFEISKENVKMSKLKMDIKLLGYAKLVE